MKKPLHVTLLGLCLLAMVSGGLAFTGDSFTPATTTRQIELVSLEDSLEPLRQHFNQGKARPRVLVLVSPT